MTINTNIKISPGNSKMGAIPSVSLPAIKTCRDCKCKEKCYAAKLERLRPTVRNAYQHNLEVLQSNPETFWREVEATVMLNRYFRFHVSKDSKQTGSVSQGIGTPVSTDCRLNISSGSASSSELNLITG